MIGRRCKVCEGLSRPVLIARNLSIRESEAHGIEELLPNRLSQVIYCGGYSDGEPPLPIPNREAKPVIADGTARPGGRVGSRRSSSELSDTSSGSSLFLCIVRILLIGVNP